MSSPTGPEPDNDSGERSKSEEVKPEAGFAGAIQGSIQGLLDRFVSSDGLAVDYDAFLTSGEYRSYELESRQLTDFNPLSLELREERLAFWINLYNMFVLQAVGTLDGTGSVQEVKGFHERKVCNIGGRYYSLNDIEYGILRGNARQPNRAWRRWRNWDVRLRAAMRPPEPCVCFALTRASRSGPALRFFDASLIEGQLFQAAVGFIANGGVIIDRERNSLSLSQIFRDYSADFGGGQGVIRFIADHLESEDAAVVRSQAGRMRIKYHGFARELNARA